MARKLSKAARACISREISKHSKKGKPKGQAIAIGFSVCRAKGFKIPQRAGLGAYKPEKSSRSRLTAKAEARAKRSAKKAATRLMRRAAKFSPEDAPRRRIQRGYID